MNARPLIQHAINGCAAETRRCHDVIDRDWRLRVHLPLKIQEHTHRPAIAACSQIDPGLFRCRAQDGINNAINLVTELEVGFNRGAAGDSSK